MVFALTIDDQGFVLLKLAGNTWLLDTGSPYLVLTPTSNKGITLSKLTTPGGTVPTIPIQYGSGEATGELMQAKFTNNVLPTMAAVFDRSGIQDGNMPFRGILGVSPSFNLAPHNTLLTDPLSVLGSMGYPAFTLHANLEAFQFEETPSAIDPTRAVSILPPVTEKWWVTEAQTIRMVGKDADNAPYVVGYSFSSARPPRVTVNGQVPAGMQTDPGCPRQCGIVWDSGTTAQLVPVWDITETPVMVQENGVIFDRVEIDFQTESGTTLTVISNMSVADAVLYTPVLNTPKSYQETGGYEGYLLFVLGGYGMAGLQHDVTFHAADQCIEIGAAV